MGKTMAQELVGLQCWSGWSVVKMMGGMVWASNLLVCLLRDQGRVIKEELGTLGVGHGLVEMVVEKLGSSFSRARRCTGMGSVTAMMLGLARRGVRWQHRV